MHGAAIKKGHFFLRVAVFGAVDVQPGEKDIGLTERHLVDEAEVTLHHLGPGQLRRRVNGNPVETVRPQGVAVKSRVIGVWSLNGWKRSKKPHRPRARTNGEIIFDMRYKYHKHVSSGDVFVHHKPGIPLSSYPRPLAQCQSEPA